ncbi:CHAT domain-containing protein [Pedobacter psychroterrae]|nr:CHAT domain-containing tetratricopeptide repeat protein [Pedobacter psychroterrae]
MIIADSGISTAVAQTVQPYTGLDKKLDSFKKEDDLTEWLYLRIDHSYHNPAQSLSFLMRTQKEIWRKPKRTAEKEAWLILLSNQAYNLLYTGNILESINYYEHSYNYFTENKLNVAGIAEYIFKPWANNYTRLGDYERALFIQKQTLEYALKENDRQLAAATYNNMAISYRSLGDYKNAERCVKSGLERLVDGSETEILLKNTLADIYKDNGNIKLAEQTITENIQQQKKRKPDFETAYWLLSSYITAGDIALLKGNFIVAQEFYHQALVINDRYYNGNRRREQAYATTQLGNVKLKQNKSAEAERYFNQTLHVLGLTGNGRLVRDQIFGDNRLIDVFYQKGLAALQTGNQKAALENIELSLLAADKVRFELADVRTKQRFQAETKEKAEQAIGIAYNLLEKTGQYQYALTILDIMEQGKARTLLESIRNNQQQLTLQTEDTLFASKQGLERAIAYNEKELMQQHSGAHGEHREPRKQLERETLNKNNEVLKFRLENLEKVLREKYPSITKAGRSAKLTVAGLLNKIPRKSRVVQFFVGQKNIYVLEVKNQRIRHIKRITNAGSIKQEIADFVRIYYHDGPAAMMNNPKVFYEASHHIYQTLLSELGIDNNEQVIIITDEVLGNLSFDGLITEKKYSTAISQWPYLIKMASISYAFSIQTLINQSQVRQNAGHRFAGLFITHQNSDKQFIPAVAKEASSIKKIVSGSFLMDEAAGIKDFLNAFDNASVLHISTHSYLSGVQKEPTLAFNDNDVFLFELSARKNAPSLVVLSACQTADGMMAKGEGIISLSRGFAAIGAQSTIAGLWNVNDDAAARITADVYHNILNGNTGSNALHLAKMNWLNGTRNGEQEYLPYYWDALIFMGHDQKLILKPAASPMIAYLLYIGLAAFISFTIWFVLRRLRLKAEYLLR